MNENLGRQFNVLDLQASRKVKQRTGRAVPIPLSNRPDSPEMTKHENEALALGNPLPPKRSLSDKILSPISRMLGLEE